MHFQTLFAASLINVNCNYEKSLIDDYQQCKK